MDRLTPSPTSFHAAAAFISDRFSPDEPYTNPHYTSAIVDVDEERTPTQREPELLFFGNPRRLSDRALLPSLEDLLQNMTLLNEEFQTLSEWRETELQRIEEEKNRAVQELTATHTDRMIALCSSGVGGDISQNVPAMQQEIALFSEQMNHIISDAERDKHSIHQRYIQRESELSKKRPSIESQIQRRTILDRQKPFLPLRITYPTPDPILTSETDKESFLHLIRPIYNRSFFPKSMDEEEKRHFCKAIEQFAKLAGENMVTFFVTDPSNIPQDIESSHLDRLYGQGVAFLGSSQTCHIQTHLFGFIPERLSEITMYFPDILDTPEDSDFIKEKMKVVDFLMTVVREMEIATQIIR